MAPQTYDDAIAEMAAKANGNGGWKLEMVVKALSLAHAEAKEWHEETSENLTQHVATERATLHGMTDMLATLEGKSLEVAAAIQESLDDHSRKHLHMSPQEFEEFMLETGVERDQKTEAAISNDRRRQSDYKVWTVKRVAKYIGGVLVVILSGLAIAWGSAEIVQQQGTKTSVENQKILMQLQSTNAELLEHIALDNDREPTPTPTPTP